MNKPRLITSRLNYPLNLFIATAGLLITQLPSPVPNSQPELLSVIKAAQELVIPPYIDNPDRFKKVANFQLPTSIKPHNISKHITKLQLEKKEYFLALASHAEGFSSSIYKDNQGWAVGNGWNLTKQSPEFNRTLAQAVFSDKKTIETLTSMSGKSFKSVTSAQMKAVALNPQKALQITYLIGEKIKKDYVVPGISKVIQKNNNLDKESSDIIARKVFFNLKKHEQDALIYHAYKCGGYSFLKFNNLITKIVDYSLKRKIVTKDSIVAEFNYSYKIKGEKYLDKHSQELVGSMFRGPKHFAEVSNIKL